MTARIDQIEVVPIRAPRKEPVRSGSNATDPVTASEFGVIRISTSDGLTGVGEISITWPRIGHTLCYAAEHLVAPALTGRDACQVSCCMAEIDRILAGELSATYIRAAFEMALLDITGKCYRIPIYQLLGGRVRDRISLAWSIYQKAPEEMAADAAKAVEEGFHAIKLKVGRKLAHDLLAVKVVSEAVRGMPLRLDANGAWLSVAEAANAIDALASVGTIAWVEQPLPRHNLDGLRLLRQRSGVPIMADESCLNLLDAHTLAREQAADVFNVYVAEAGGIYAAASIFSLGDALNIPGILGSQAEMGIGTAACAHLGVALPNLPYACETFGPLRYCRDILTTPVPIANGYLEAPEGPGLGVEVDWAAVQDMRVSL